MEVLQTDKRLCRVFERLEQGIDGARFDQVIQSLKTQDPYMVLADFDTYLDAQQRSADTYFDRERWGQMALLNTAKSGVFSADRAIREYAETIWHC